MSYIIHVKDRVSKVKYTGADDFDDLKGRLRANPELSIPPQPINIFIEDNNNNRVQIDPLLSLYVDGALRYPASTHLFIEIVQVEPAPSQQPQTDLKSIMEAIQKLSNEIRELRSNETFSISDLNEESWNRIANKYALVTQPANFITTREHPVIKPYEWTADGERQQTGDCMEYLENNFSCFNGKSQYFINITGIQQLFTDYLSNFRLKGTADIVAVTKPNLTGPDTIRSNTIFVIELKKPKSIGGAGVEAQSKGELLAANYVCHHPVIHILTDLGTKWVFRWLSKPNIIFNHTVNSPQAAYVIMDMLHNKRPHTRFFKGKYRNEQNPFLIDDSHPSTLRDILPAKQQCDIANLDDLDDMFHDPLERQHHQIEKLLYATQLSSNYYT